MNNNISASAIEQVMLSRDSEPIVFKEDVQIQKAKVINEIRRTADGDAKTTPSSVIPGDFIDLDKSINPFFKNAADDIDIVDIALRDVNAKVPQYIDEFNYLKSDMDQGLRRAQSALDQYALYASITAGNIGVVSEEFKTKQNILNSSNLFVDETEGVLTLPVKRIEDIDLEDAVVRIGETSNGSFKEGHGIEKAFDGDDISYCEYTQATVNDKLILELKIDLNQTRIANSIFILPNNFARQNWIEIEEVSSSVDGETFTSVTEASDLFKSMIQSADATTILVDPKLQKSGEAFSISFHPRRLRYLKVRLSQRNKDLSTNEYRIGIQEFMLRRIVYENDGVARIVKTIPGSRISSLAVHSDQSILDSDAIKVDYTIGLNPDKLFPIQPVESEETGVEILQINAPWTPNSAEVESDLTNRIALNIRMSKETLSGKLNSFLAESITRASEFFDFPSELPHEFSLKQEARAGSLGLTIMPYMAIGKRDFNKLQLGTTTEKVPYYSFKLPFNPKGMETVYWGDTLLTKSATYERLYQTGLMSYFIDDIKNLIHINLNNDVTQPLTETKHLDPWMEGYKKQNTIIKPSLDHIVNGTPITIEIKHDSLSPDSNKKIKLTFQCDGIKNNIRIWRVAQDGGNPKIEQIKDLITQGKTVTKLSGKPLLDHDIHLVGGHRIDYIDGSSEFRQSSEYAYSIDDKEGILYLKNKYPQDVHISYYRVVEDELKPSDFDVADDLQTISIKEWAFDATAKYTVEYSVALAMPSDMYELKNNKTIKLTDKTISELQLSQSPFKDKKIRAAYSYNEDMKQTINDMIESITPIINKVEIIYAKVL